MDSSKVVASVVSLTLDLPPSCIQFCPAHPDYFVVGTYNLDRDETVERVGIGEGDETAATTAKMPQNRNGSLIVFKIEETELTLVQTLSQPSAILDLRFHPVPDQQDILAVVSSTGTLAVFKVDPESDLSCPLKHIATSRCDDINNDVLFLQCNWHPTVPNVIGVTTSTGAARLLRLDAGYRIRDPSVDLDVANTLEAWCIHFSPPPPDTSKGSTQGTVYCGGDDSMIRYISCSLDTSNEGLVQESPFPPITIKGHHTAGVTAILPLPLFLKDTGRIVVTGSYDDHLRVFLIHDLHETYGLKRIELVLEEKLGGGVWRLDLVNIRRKADSLRIRILASCMHAGARLLDLEVQNGENWACNILAQFEEHKSMNYGSDFVRGSKVDDGLRCVSTSFYDKLLCVWDYKPSEEK
ncbi:WD40-repeat-containing domain protein [Thelonectria olida]|uniref:WD40-repeat-containing domain protein n=1 Tax=Thelonectria olida TaxID=1576542 RepID=A0A9P8W6E8_9HYPO|nr:WD40-repeat-containing domain protein [Thelonectria olida]